jgi:hypothetical protein
MVSPYTVRGTDYAARVSDGVVTLFILVTGDCHSGAPYDSASRYGAKPTGGGQPAAGAVLRGAVVVMGY